MNKKSRQIFKFLENEKSFKDEIKKHFFEGESPSLMYHNTSIFKLFNLDMCSVSSVDNDFVIFFNI